VQNERNNNRLEFHPSFTSFIFLQSSFFNPFISTQENHKTEEGKRWNRLNDDDVPHSSQWFPTFQIIETDLTIRWLGMWTKSNAFDGEKIKSGVIVSASRLCERSLQVFHNPLIVIKRNVIAKVTLDFHFLPFDLLAVTKKFHVIFGFWWSISFSGKFEGALRVPYFWARCIAVRSNFLVSFPRR